MSQDSSGLRAAGGTTRLDLGLTAALNMQADTILIISDGIPRVGKVLSEAQAEAHRERVAAWQAANSKNVSNWDAKWGNGGGEVDRVWVPPQAAPKPKKKTKKEIEAEQAAAKLPPREGQGRGGGGGGGGRAGHWKIIRDRNYKPRPQPPGAPKPGMWTLNDFIEHVTRMHAHYYKPSGLPEPKVFGIGYAIDKDGHRFLQQLSKHYKGQYRRVARIR